MTKERQAGEAFWRLNRNSVVRETLWRRVFELPSNSSEQQLLLDEIKERYDDDDAIRGGPTATLNMRQEIQRAIALEAVDLLHVSLDDKYPTARRWVEGLIGYEPDWKGWRRWFNQLPVVSGKDAAWSPRLAANWLREEFGRTPQRAQRAFLRLVIASVFDEKSRQEFGTIVGSGSER